jgi:hypothetical protein
MKITLLGTGTPTPSLKRASSGYLIEVGDDVIVMDHGPNAHQRLLESGRRAADVSHVFLSHLHYDHCMDYPRLVLQRWDIGAGRVPDLEVYGPPPLARMTELLFGADGVYGPDIRARIEHQGSIDIFEARGGKAPRARPNPRVTEVRPGEVIDGGGWKMTVGEASHVQPYLECYGYRLDSADGSLCYSGDSGGVCKGIIELAKGCDVLIHMDLSGGVRQPRRHRQGGATGRRQDPGPDPHAGADRPARRARADHQGDDGDLRRQRHLGRGPDGDSATRSADGEDGVAPPSDRRFSRRPRHRAAGASPASR